MGMLTRAKAKDTGVAPVIQTLPPTRRKKKPPQEPPPPRTPAQPAAPPSAAPSAAPSSAVPSVALLSAPAARLGVVQSQPQLSQHAPTEEEEVTEELYHNDIRDKLMTDKTQAHIIRAASSKGNYSWLTSNSRLVPTRLFKLAVMPRIGIAHPSLPSNLQCPGCHALLTPRTALTHVSGCVKCSGNNATAKHNRMVRNIYELCIKSGLPCELEPRQFSTYTCAKCGASVDGDGKSHHLRTCGSGSFYHSGPDIVIHWASGDVYYDFTIVHELSQSNVGRSTAQLFRDAIKRKVSKYVASKLIPNEQFQCVPMLSGGAMHSNTKALITTLADACGLERDFVVQDFTLRLQELNGSVVMSQLRKYIATTQVDNTAF